MRKKDRHGRHVISSFPNPSTSWRLRRASGWWTCGPKIGLADVLVPDAFVTAHVSFKTGDENDEEEEEVWCGQNERVGRRWDVKRPENAFDERECGYGCCLFTAWLMFLECCFFGGEVRKVGDREKN